MPTDLLTSKVWEYSKISTNTFPESSFVSNETAVCISGGSSRSFSAGIGQLRALNHLGLIDKINYLSVVSGGSWIGSLFCYANIPTRDLLGKVTCVKDLTLEYLGILEENYAGTCATKSIAKLFNSIIQKIPDQNVWIDIVKNIYLKPYQLDQNKLFALNQKHLSEILVRNPQLSKDQFYLPQENRPFLITNATLIWPENLFMNESLQLFQYNALYSGILKPHNISDLIESRKFGGGFIETIALNSTEPNLVNNGSEKLAKTNKPSPFFSLAEMIGSSSAFFCSFLDRYPLARRFSPMFQYWPITEATPKHTYLSSVGDGGNLENFAILPMLQRQVKKIVVFINTSTPLQNPHKDEKGKWQGIDEFIPPLFGEYSLFWDKSRSEPITKVFSSEQLTNMIEHFVSEQKAGKTVMYKQKFKVLDNSFFDIHAYEPEILWVYNSKIPEWEKLLDQSIQQEIELGSKGMFPCFPHYSTFDENLHFLDPRTWKDLGNLTASQVNLLAELSSWNVLNNADLFKEMLTVSEEQTSENLKFTP